MSKLKGTLLLKKQVADIVSMAILDFKDQFKNLDLDVIQNDLHYIIYLMNFIETKCNDKELMSLENKDKIDKNEILKSIIRGIFPNITQTELVVIESIIDIALSQKLVKAQKTAVQKIFKCLKKKVLG
jgi:hypothetical protein